MNAKDENLLVKLLKKAVGLPTHGSDCSCSTIAPAVPDCCEAGASGSASTGCGCAPASHQANEQPLQERV